MLQTFTLQNWLMIYDIAFSFHFHLYIFPPTSPNITIDARSLSAKNNINNILAMARGLIKLNAITTCLLVHG